MVRDLCLKERTENVRAQQKIRYVVHFNLQEIKDRFDDSIRSIEQKFDIYDQLIKLGNEEEAKDILRSQIVFLESILDFYIHEMTKYSYYKMFTNTWKKTSQYRNFKVKMETVEKGLNAVDTQWFFEYVTDAFSRSVFLSNKSISNQLDAIGIPYQDVMHKVFSQSTVKESCTKGKEFIDHVFIRRNIIVIKMIEVMTQRYKTILRNPMLKKL